MRPLLRSILLRRGQSKSLALTCRLDPFQQQLQSRPVHLSRAHRAPVADEAACLQPLRPQAEAAAIEFAGTAAQFGLIEAKDANLDAYITARTLDGLFKMIAAEERAIRRDPIGQTSRLLQRVFGLVKPVAKPN